MKKGKFSGKTKWNSKAILVLVSVVLICAAAIGGTIAYLSMNTENVVNAFEPAHVTSQVVEDPFNNVTKTNAKIKNTGDVSAYIRAAIVVTWMDSQGNVLHYAPGTADYSMTLNETHWTEGTDGYYYYKSPVAPDGVTEPLITSATANYKNGDYFVSIEILSSAIQSEGKNSDGKTPVELAWGVEAAQLVGAIK